jgi:4-amino-4-deoxy-L-arabinose transferase-like glycosyltransferase
MPKDKNLPANIQLRYGMRSRRVAPILVGILIAGLVSGSLAYATFRQQNPSVTGQLLTFKVISPTQVDVTWELARGPQLDSYCVVRAQDASRADVGYATVTVAGGSNYEQITYPLATNGQAVLAEVLGCANSQKMRVPPANFPPGVKIPDQVPPGVAPTS